MTRNEILRGIVGGHALRDAKLFFDEFGEMLDPATTDWDGTAWTETLAELKRADWTDEELGQDWLFAHYSAVLLAETERLASR